MIPRALLPDAATYRGPGVDLGSGPIEQPELLVRLRIEPSTKLITYADGRTANATDFVIAHPVGQDIDGAGQPFTPRIEGVLFNSPLWADYGERKVMSVRTLRLADGRVHHHELWVGLA